MREQRAPSGEGGRCCRGCDEVSRKVPSVMAMYHKRESWMNLLFLLFCMRHTLAARLFEEMQYLTPNRDHLVSTMSEVYLPVVEAKA